MHSPPRLDGKQLVAEIGLVVGEIAGHSDFQRPFVVAVGVSHEYLETKKRTAPKAAQSADIVTFPLVEVGGWSFGVSH